MITTRVTSSDEIRAFFDKEALFIEQRHGPVNGLLDYRVGLIKRYFPQSAEITVLDIGCGTGHHLLAVAPFIRRGIGIYFSTATIGATRKRLGASSWKEKISFRIDDAEELKTIPDSSVDVVICIGVLEHVVNKKLLLSNVHRVLTPFGRFVCLTPNGSHFWYSLATALHVPTKHLSTDVFLTEREVTRFLISACFRDIEVGYWSFIPRGDVHRVIAFLLAVMDLFGKGFRINALRGGLIIAAAKPVDHDVLERCGSATLEEDE